MSQDLLATETHATNLLGSLKTSTRQPVNGDELENIENGEMYYDNAKEIVYIYYDAWYGAAMTAS